MTIISTYKLFFVSLILLLLTILKIIHIEYVKPVLTKDLTAHDCGGPQFVEAPEQVPTLSSPKSRSGNDVNYLILFGTSPYSPKNL